MELLPEEVRRVLPSLYATESESDPVVQVKFFTPDSDWTWYAIEFDGDDLFFGLAEGFVAELGYFRLSELKSIRGPFGLPVERDLYFTPMRLSKLLSEKSA
jgi:hypothetical protein